MPGYQLATRSFVKDLTMMPFQEQSVPATESLLAGLPCCSTSDAILEDCLIVGHTSFQQRRQTLRAAHIGEEGSLAFCRGVCWRTLMRGRSGMLAVEC